MKKLYFIHCFVCFIAFFCSCKPEVDLYGNYEEIPIVYALLNPNADTNFVKITRAFRGSEGNLIDATEVAQIYDSSNYQGKLEARIFELKSTYGNHFEPTGRVFELDTITLHNKVEGVFYSPDQLFYYTTEKFLAGSESNRYKYRLMVVKPDGDTLTAVTSMVGNEEFAIMTGGVAFDLQPTDELGTVKFKADGAAQLYEVAMEFNYREQHEGQEMKYKRVHRSFGTKPLSLFQQVDYSDNMYFEVYSRNWLFNALANAIGSDIVDDPEHPNVVRYVGDFNISVSAAGEDMYYYYMANEAQQNSPVGFTTVYSNIDGGYGLFSSRARIERKCSMSNWTLSDLYGKTEWGFKEQ